MFSHYYIIIFLVSSNNFTKKGYMNIYGHILYNVIIYVHICLHIYIYMYSYTENFLRGICTFCMVTFKYSVLTKVSFILCT